MPKILLKGTSFLLRLFLYRETLKDNIQKFGLPRLVHVHVAGNGGIGALWLRWKYGLPYLISEHWGGYLNNGNAGYNALPRYRRSLIKKMYKNAHAVSAVSFSLAHNLQALFRIPDCNIITNVVDNSLFKPAAVANNTRLQFIHISTLDYPKNPEAIIAGFGMFYQKTGIDFLLTVVGPPHAELKTWCTQYGIQDMVKWERERPQAELVPLLQQSDALVLFSRHETFGCVVIEANACGVPALVSNVPVFHEIVKDGFNGIIAKGSSAADLCEMLETFVQKRATFNPEAISKHTAATYNYQAAGRLFEAWYAEAQKACPEFNK